MRAITLEAVEDAIKAGLKMDDTAQLFGVTHATLKGFLARNGTTFTKLKIRLDAVDPKQKYIKNIRAKKDRVARMMSLQPVDFKRMMARYNSFEHMREEYRLWDYELEAIIRHFGVDRPWLEDRIAGSSNPAIKFAFYSQWSKSNSSRRSNFAYRL